MLYGLNFYHEYSLRSVAAREKSIPEDCRARDTATDMHFVKKRIRRYGGPAFLCNEKTSKICFGVSYVAQIEGFESAASSFSQGADSERRAYF